MSGSGDGLQLAVGALILGGGLLGAAFKRQKRARLLEDTARSKSSSAAQGFAEFEGFAWPLAKVTHRSAAGEELVFHRLELQEEVQEGTGKSRRRVWRTRWSHHSEDPFYLLDGNGLVIVDPKNANLSCENDTRLWDKIPAAERQILEGRITGVANFPRRAGLLGFLLAGKFRIVETKIRIGSPLLVQGSFASEHAMGIEVEEPGLGDFAKRVFEETSGGVRKLGAAFDKNGDGKISSNEARGAYYALALTAFKQGRLNGDKKFAVHGSISESATHPLFVSDEHEHHTIEKLRKGLRIQMALGGVALAGGIFLLVPGGLDSVGRPPRYETTRTDREREETRAAVARTEAPALEYGALPTKAVGPRFAVAIDDGVMIFRLADKRPDYFRRDWKPASSLESGVGSIDTRGDFALVKAGGARSLFQVVKLSTGEVADVYPAPADTEAYLMGPEGKRLVILGPSAADGTRALSVVDRKTRATLRVLAGAIRGRPISHRLSADGMRLAILSSLDRVSSLRQVFDLGSPDRLEAEVLAGQPPALALGLDETTPARSADILWGLSDPIFGQDEFRALLWQEPRLDFALVFRPADRRMIVFDQLMLRSKVLRLSDKVVAAPANCALDPVGCGERYAAEIRPALDTAVDDSLKPRVRALAREMHFMCMGGVREACGVLFQMKDDLKLAPAYLQAYAVAGCRFGEAQLCDYLKSAVPEGPARTSVAAQIAVMNCGFVAAECPTSLVVPARTPAGR